MYKAKPSIGLINNLLKTVMTPVALLAISLQHSYAESNMAIMTDAVAKLQYSMGYTIAKSDELKGIEIDQPALLAGIQDALSGQLQLSEDEMRQVLLDLGQKIIASNNTIEEKLVAYREKNLAFLVENQTRSGVISTQSGLQYEILQRADGPVPGFNNQVDVLYKGSLINGHEFESTVNNSEPARFKVSRVIKGWAEALQLMSPGAKWRLYVPAELAYGSKGVEHLIPPDSTLILDVELVAIN